eukprot:m.68491 g.68491  ORF g.68491 m.68491 type:complete len:69 (+) comp23960_c0_seq1:1249-1455(+)
MTSHELFADSPLAALHEVEILDNDIQKFVQVCSENTRPKVEENKQSLSEFLMLLNDKEQPQQVECQQG